MILCKRTIITTIITLVSFFTLSAQSPQVKKAAKNMFKITTFTAEGTILKTGYGVFVSSEGDCLGNWEPFVGASSATVIDVQGRKYDVDCLIGANEIYNVAKFRVIVPTEKKMAITPLSIATASIETGAEAWFIEYAIKTPKITKYSPSKVETFQQSLPYYIFEQTADEELAGAPFLNSMGELLGLMQPAKKRTDLYCPSAQYAMSMTSTGLTANEATLKQSLLRIALPKDYNQAVLALMMLQKDMSKPKYLSTAEEFISLFPDAAEGYTAKADYYCGQRKFAEADEFMKKSIESCSKKEDLHFDFSKMIYNNLVSGIDSTFTEWTFEKSLDEINKAYELNPLALYSMHKAKVLYANKQYKEAYDTFIEVSKTNMRNADCFYDAALCLQAMNESKEKVIEMLDSAVNCYEKPYKPEAAPYLLIRGKYYENIDMPRKAVNDFNAYEEAMNQRVGASFYYMREQTELKSRQYQQAINDIEKAIQLAPHEQIYYAERALLFTKLNKLDEGLKYAEECTRLFPQYEDGYAVLGLANILNNNKKSGIELLEKAKSLGSEMAVPLLEKYK